MTQDVEPTSKVTNRPHAKISLKQVIDWFTEDRMKLTETYTASYSAM